MAIYVNAFGTLYRITLIGSSHGSLVGVVVDGVPPGTDIDSEKIQVALTKRAPGQSHITTRRKEEERLIIETGVREGKATGEPIVAYVRNTDVDSSYYDEIRITPRPGHADFPAYIKYQGMNDNRGGGRFSGRMTVGIVIAGAIAAQILSKQGIEILAYTTEIANICAEPQSKQLNHATVYAADNIVRTANLGVVDDLVSAVESARKEGDSVGGIIECQITGVPVGLGEPFFDSVESSLAHMLFSIPAVKGVEFGAGFQAAKMRGSEHNDPFYFTDTVQTTTNHAGGILGGLADGMPIIFRAAFKPTASISKLQDTVNLHTNESVKLKIRGRHDPCIVPRAVPVVEHAAAIVMLDLLLRMVKI